MVDDPGQATGADEGTADFDHEPAAEETLRRLESQLLRASEAAERLIREAAGRVGGDPGAGRADGGPGAGSDRGGRPEGRQSDGGDPNGPLDPQDLQLPGAVWDRLTDLVPPELQRRVAEALRELLLAVRALLDWYLERLEHRRPEPPEVKDIPIL